MSPVEIARTRASKEKRLVAGVSVLAAILLTGMKLVVGLFTGSLGLLSEAAHSGLDLVAAVVTFFAVRASDRPPDQEHTYGHGKFENLSALFETALLLMTCLWIIYEGVQRLFLKTVHVAATWWAFVVLAISMVVDISRSRALSRVARAHRSQALEADALHFSTDIWSSAVVLLGLVLVRVADLTGAAWLHHADAIAALGVAAIVIWVGARLGRRAAADLVDAISPALRAGILEAVQVDGVLEVGPVRLRRSGPQLFVEASLAADRGTSFERAHLIATEAEAAVRASHPDADVVVKVHPVPSGKEGLLDAVRLVAARHGLRVFGIRIHFVLDRPSVEMNLEVDDSLSLEQAHHRSSEFERALKREIPFLERVVTRLEPVGDESATFNASRAEEESVDLALKEISHELPVVIRPREVIARRTGEKLSVSFHCAIGHEASLTEAHTLTEEIERRLRARMPYLDRVMIRAEPLAHLTLGEVRASLASEATPTQRLFSSLWKRNHSSVLRPARSQEREDESDPFNPT